MGHLLQLIIVVFFLQACTGVKVKKAISADDFTAGVEVGDPGKMPKLLLIAMKSGEKIIKNIELGITLKDSLKALLKKATLINFFVYKDNVKKKLLLNHQSFKSPGFPTAVTLSIEDFKAPPKVFSDDYTVVAEIGLKNGKALAYGEIKIKKGTKVGAKGISLMINQLGEHAHAH
jgi:hypothetical protein